MQSKPLFQIIGIGFEDGFSPLFDQTLKALKRKFPFKWLSKSHSFGNQKMLPNAPIPIVFYPHLITDTPLYLFIGDDPTKHREAILELLPLTHRIVFSSDNVKDTLALNTFLRQIPCAPTDLLDLFTRGWRHILSKVLSEKENYDIFMASDQISIHTSFPPLGTFLKKWLETMLKSMPIEIIHQPKNTHPAITTFSCKGKGEAIKIASKNTYATVQITLKKRCELPYNLPLETDLIYPFFTEECS